MKIHRFILLAALLTSSTASALDIEGPIRSTSGSIDVRIQAGANGAAGIGSFSNDPVLFFSASNERMRLSTSGYLGIGTTGPRRNLHIFDPAGWPEILIESGYTPANNGRIWGLISSPVDGRLTIRAANADISSANGVMTFDPSGSVGIGTGTPLAPLQVGDGTDASSMTGVAGSIRATSHSFSTGITARRDGYAEVGMRAGPMGEIGNFTNHPLALITNATERMRIDTSGNVGIGTTTPNAKLEVLGGEVRFSGGTNPGSWYTHFNYQGDGRNYIRGTTLIADNGGNVGIGTTNPTHKLAVNGTIKAKEVIVETTGWSDYVFADDYALAPLAEVEAHIKEHKHLPGIPSAAQVAANGVSLGEVQAALLAKVEEITLHQIAQQKELASLRAENAALKTRVQQLEIR